MMEGGALFSFYRFWCKVGWRGYCLRPCEVRVQVRVLQHSRGFETSD